MTECLSSVAHELSHPPDTITFEVEDHPKAHIKHIWLVVNRIRTTKERDQLMEIGKPTHADRKDLMYYYNTHQKTWWDEMPLKKGRRVSVDEEIAGTAKEWVGRVRVDSLSSRQVAQEICAFMTRHQKKKKGALMIRVFVKHDLTNRDDDPRLDMSLKEWWHTGIRFNRGSTFVASQFHHDQAEDMFEYVTATKIVGRLSRVGEKVSRPRKRWKPPPPPFSRPQKSSRKGWKKWLGW